jgi:hypothetical protein
VGIGFFFMVVVLFNMGIGFFVYLCCIIVLGYSLHLNFIWLFIGIITCDFIWFIIVIFEGKLESDVEYVN